MLPSQFQLASMARAMLPYLSYHLRPPGLSSPHTGVDHKPPNLTVSPRSLRSGSKRVPVLLSRAQEVSATGARAVVRATPNTKHDNHSGMPGRATKPVKYRPRIQEQSSYVCHCRYHQLLQWNCFPPRAAWSAHDLSPELPRIMRAEPIGLRCNAPRRSCR